MVVPGSVLGAIFWGVSRIESEARIGPNVIIEDSTIGSGAVVQPFSSVTDLSDIRPWSVDQKIVPRYEAALLG